MIKFRYIPVVLAAVAVTVVAALVGNTTLPATEVHAAPVGISQKVVIKKNFDILIAANSAAHKVLTDAVTDATNRTSAAVAAGVTTDQLTALAATVTANIEALKVPLPSDKYSLSREGGVLSITRGPKVEAAPISTKAVNREINVDSTEVSKRVAAVTASVVAWETELKAENDRRAAAAAAKAAAEAAAAAQAAQAAKAARSHAAPRAPRSGGGAVAAPAGGGDKESIARNTFARWGYSNVVYNSGRAGGHYAGTDMNGGTVIYMELNNIPVNRVASTAIHEYMHVLQGRQYGGYDGAIAHFGSLIALEKNADCMALQNGASWVHYGC